VDFQQEEEEEAKNSWDIALCPRIFHVCQAPVIVLLSPIVLSAHSFPEQNEI